MSDDLPQAMLVTAVSATLSAADPSGGVMSGIAALLATKLSSDAGWQNATQDIWQEVLIEEKGEREKQFQEVRNEFERHKLILDMLREDLAAAWRAIDERDGRVSDLHCRVEVLEVAVLGVMHQSESMLRANTDPEMRSYLVNAFRNAVQRPDYFNGTWMARCMAMLDKLGADHLKLLSSFASHGHEVVTHPNIVHIVMDTEAFSARTARDPDARAAWGELTGTGGLIPLGPGMMTTRILVLPRTVWRLIELISPEPLTLKPTPQL